MRIVFLLLVTITAHAQDEFAASFTKTAQRAIAESSFGAKKRRSIERVLTKSTIRISNEILYFNEGDILEVPALIRGSEILIHPRSWQSMTEQAQLKFSLHLLSARAGFAKNDSLTLRQLLRDSTDAQNQPLQIFAQTAHCDRKSQFENKKGQKMKTTVRENFEQVTWSEGAESFVIRLFQPGNKGSENIAALSYEQVHRDEAHPDQQIIKSHQVAIFRKQKEIMSRAHSLSFTRAKTSDPATVLLTASEGATMEATVKSTPAGEVMQMKASGNLGQTPGWRGLGLDETCLQRPTDIRQLTLFHANHKKTLIEFSKIFEASVIAQRGLHACLEQSAIDCAELAKKAEDAKLARDSAWETLGQDTKSYAAR